MLRPRVFSKALNARQRGGFLGKEVLWCSLLLASGGLGVTNLWYAIEIEAYRAEMVLIFSGVIFGPYCRIDCFGLKIWILNLLVTTDLISSFSSTSLVLSTMLSYSSLLILSLSVSLLLSLLFSTFSCSMYSFMSTPTFVSELLVISQEHRAIRIYLGWGHEGWWAPKLPCAVQSARYICHMYWFI